MPCARSVGPVSNVLLLNTRQRAEKSRAEMCSAAAGQARVPAGTGGQCIMRKVRWVARQTGWTGWTGWTGGLAGGRGIAGSSSARVLAEEARRLRCIKGPPFDLPRRRPTITTRAVPQGPDAQVRNRQNNAEHVEKVRRTSAGGIMYCVGYCP